MMRRFERYLALALMTARGCCVAAAHAQMKPTPVAALNGVPHVSRPTRSGRCCRPTGRGGRSSASSPIRRATCGRRAGAASRSGIRRASSCSRGTRAGPDGNWSTIHGLFVDHNGFVWTNARESNLTVKFTRTGQVAMVIGKFNETGGSNDTTLMGRPSEIWVDPADNEVFVADGYGNRRIIVFDGATGKYLRHWGAYGKRPEDPPARSAAAATRRRRAQRARQRRRKAAAARQDGRRCPAAAAAAVRHSARHRRLARRAHLPCRSRQQSHPGVPPERRVRARADSAAALRRRRRRPRGRRSGRAESRRRSRSASRTTRRRPICTSPTAART